MSPVELRLYEIKFMRFVNGFFKNTHAPYEIYKYMDMMAKVFDSDQLTLREATELVIRDDYAIRPKQGEYLLALVDTGTPIAQACKQVGTSRPTYYREVQRFKDFGLHVAPTFPNYMHSAVIKFIDGMVQLKEFL